MPKNSQQYVTKRSLKNFNSKKFLDEVAAINWWEVYNCGTVDEAVRMFTEGVNRILDRKDMAAVRTFQQRQKYAPWLSAETKSMMAERDAAVKEARHTSRPEDLAKATKLRNMCTRLLRTEKHRYLKQKLDICKEERDVSGMEELKKLFGLGKFLWFTNGTHGSIYRTANKFPQEDRKYKE